MQTIQEAVDKTVAEMISGGAIEKVIKDSVEKSITRALENQFQSYGGITKQIEEAIKGGLKVDVGNIPFDSYNAQMLVAIKQRLGDMFAGQAYEHFIGQIDAMMEPAPKEISIDDFLEKIAAIWKTDEPWNADDMDERMFVELEEGGYSSDSWTINIKKKESDKYASHGSEELKLYFIDGKIRINHKHSYNPTCFSEAEAYVFKMYAAGTEVTGIDQCDPEGLDLTLKDCDY